METTIMKAELKMTKFKIKFWSKLARYFGERALEAIEDLNELKEEVEKCYPELNEYIR